MRDFNKSKLEERFNTDAEFNRLVNAMYSMIWQHGFTHSELREAAFLAAYKYEMENPKAVTAAVHIRMEEFLNAVKPGAIS